MRDGHGCLRTSRRQFLAGAGALGATVQAEFYTGEGDGIGVATDSGGNVYRILF